MAGYLQLRERITGDRVAIEIRVQVGELAEIADQQLGRAFDVACRRVHVLTKESKHDVGLLGDAAQRAEVVERRTPVRTNDELGQRPYVAGSRYSVADITAVVAIDFMKPAKLVVPVGLGHVQRWYREVSARPAVADQR